MQKVEEGVSHFLLKFRTDTFKYFLASLIYANPRRTHLPTGSGVVSRTDLTHRWLPAVVDWQSHTTTEVVIKHLPLIHPK